MKTAPAVILGSMLSALVLATLIRAGKSPQTKSAPGTPDPSVYVPDTAQQRHDAQACLLGSTSCLDIDPRPFEVCLAGEDRCDQSYSMEQIQLADSSGTAAQPGVPEDAASSRP